MKDYIVKVGDKYIREYDYSYLVEVDGKENASKFREDVAKSIADHVDGEIEEE